MAKLARNPNRNSRTAAQQQPVNFVESLPIPEHTKGPTNLTGIKKQLSTLTTVSPTTKTHQIKLYQPPTTHQWTKQFQVVPLKRLNHQISQSFIGKSDSTVTILRSPSPIIQRKRTNSHEATTGATPTMNNSPPRGNQTRQTQSYKLSNSISDFQ